MSLFSREVYVFVGPPGCGKGTLAQLCIDRLGWTQVSTGNLCRKNIQEQTDVGRAIDFEIKSGKLVSDALVTDMVTNWFMKGGRESSPVIVDGYPRTLEQARSFDSFLKREDAEYRVHIVFFDIAHEKVAQRLINRSVCSNKECQAVYSLASGTERCPKRDNMCDYCRSPLMRRGDDSGESISVRLATYDEHDKQLRNYYKGTLHDLIFLQADQSVEALYRDFMRRIGLAVE